MRYLSGLFFLINAEAASEEGGSTGGSTEKLTNALKAMVKSPWFYVVIGLIVLLIIGVYLLRRFVKPTPNQVKVVVRKGSIYKLIDEKSDKYFMVPFTDGLGAVIGLNEKEFSSDKLFVNNGPDALYKINYTLKYKVSDVNKFYPHRDSFQNKVVIKINDNLRDYADNGHVLEIIKDYREHSKDLLFLLNGLTDDFGVEVTNFKINFIEPMGKK